MHRLDGVVERNRALRRDEVGDLQVIAAPFGPDQRRHAEHPAAHGLGVLSGQCREIGFLEVLLEAFDIEPRSLGRQPVGGRLINR